MEHQTKTLTDLPQDLVFNIFGRLSCEELLPLTAVCKGWKSIVKGKSFTKYHKNNDEDAEATKIILTQLVCEDQKITTKIYILDLHKIKLFSVKVPYTTSAELFVNFVGSQNGIMCIRRAFNGAKHVLTIFNPVTMDYVDTEDFVNYVPHEHTLHTFGYNKFSNSFEIMVLYVNPSDSKRVWWTKYILKTYTWVDAQPTGIEKDFISGETISLDMHYVWASEVNGPPFRHVQYLIVFDKHSNEFSEIRIPEDIVNVNYKLVQHFGKVGFLFYNFIFDGPYTIELWTCDVASGNENSWTPVFSVYNFPSFFEPICVIDDYTLLTTGSIPHHIECSSRKRNDIFLYNVKQQQWTRATNLFDYGFLWYRTSYEFIPTFQNVRM